MAADFRIRGVAKPIPAPLPKSQKLSQFEEVLKESEQLISEANLKEDDVIMMNPDMSFSIKSISSIYLDTNSKFQDLKKNLEQYHLDCRRKNSLMHPGKSVKWKQIIYTSLHKLLNECIFTNIRKLQLEYLDKVYDWYYEKVGKENSLKPQQKNEEITVKDIEENMEELNVPENLAQYSRRQINSAHSLRPKTANVTHSKVFDSRPTSAVKVPIQAFIGSGEPMKEVEPVGFQSSYVSYMPISEEAERKTEERFQQFRNKDLAEKRLRDEMKQKVDTWTSLRARKSEEFNRKFESNRFASRFDQRAYSPSRPHTASDAQFLKKNVFEMQDPQKEAEKPQEAVQEPVVEELPLHKLDKIATLRKLHEEILEGDESIDEPNNVLDFDPSAVTLSAYAKNANVWTRSFSRPHTAGYLPPPRNTVNKGLSGFNRPVTAQRAEQIDEIFEVKKRLARKNIPCSIDTLKYGLLMPEDLPPESLTHLNLPPPGAGLLHNPFTKIKKKGKKKKGKKGKKGKKK